MCSLARAQPMKVLENWRDKLLQKGSMYQSGHGNEHRLKSKKLGHMKAGKCSTATVEPWHNQ